SNYQRQTRDRFDHGSESEQLLHLDLLTPRLSLLLLLIRLVRGWDEFLLNGPLFRRGHLRPAQLEGELVNRAGEPERQLVALVHSRAGIQADVEGFVNGHDQRNRVRDRLLRQLPAVHRKYASTALARAGAVVFEVEHECVFAWLE